MMAIFSRLTRYTEWIAAHPLSSIGAWLLCAVWLASGPFFGWSDTWQLIITSTTNIITFILVFMIQSTQTRDTQAIHVKLDEIMKALGRKKLLDIEERQPDEIAKAQQDEQGDAG